MKITHQLADLPDDILFLVLANLDCTRDLWALALSCRRFHHLVNNDGWRVFVRTRFPSLTIPSPVSGRHTWKQLAESTTWQSRCWDKRSLQFQALLPYVEPRRNDRPQGGGRGLFMSVVDAHYDPANQEELVLWGAGEDIVARYRRRQGHGKVSKTSWQNIDGKELGLSAGYDDVKTVKVVKQGSGRAVLTGRHNGQLSLLSAEPSRFGEHIAQFSPGPDQDIDAQQPLEQETITSLDVLQSGRRTLIAAAAKSSLRVYELPEEDVLGEVAPVTTYDIKESILSSSSARLDNARWMENGGSIALALVGCKDPLRYLSLTPTGWSHHAAAKSKRVEEEFSIKYDRTICPNSLEPVHFRPGARRGTSLLLSSWRDGTIRLQDLRTPSPFDAVYQDNVDPWSNAEALMAYGTDRFLAGGGDGLTIQIFDFRWPKPYYHTSGLPCLSRPPFPHPHQPFMKPLPTPDSNPGSHCDYPANLPCHWHFLSRSLYYRPNAKFFLSESLRSLSRANNSRRSAGSTVWSLARASDLSPNFYIGISGGVIEATLEQTPDTLPPDTATVDPNFGFSDWRAAAPPESGCRSKPLVPALMETGDGYSFKGNDRSILLPGLRRYQGPREWKGAEMERVGLRRWHRLDGGYQMERDFVEGGLD